MENIATNSAPATPSATFKVGDEVSYGIHGKCVVTAIETKTLGDKVVRFYQIKALRNPLAPKVVAKNTPAILIPISSAESNGLRNPMNKEQADLVLRTLADPDYHFNLNESWGLKQKVLEEALRKEGAIGLAKVVGHLHYIMKKDAAPRGEVLRFYESVLKHLVRELGDSLDIQSRDAENLIFKALRSKLGREDS